MKKLDPDAMSDDLAAAARHLRADLRTAHLGVELDELRLRINAALVPAHRVVPKRAPCEASRQAREQGVGDCFSMSGLEVAVLQHGGRFVERTLPA